MKPAPPVISTRPAPNSGRPLTLQNCAHGSQHYRKIQPQRPPPDVVHVDGEHLAEGHPAARGDLVEASDPGFDRKAAARGLVIDLELGRDRRRGAADAAASRPNYDKLRHSVSGAAPHDSP